MQNCFEGPIAGSIRPFRAGDPVSPFRRDPQASEIAGKPGVWSVSRQTFCHPIKKGCSELGDLTQAARLGVAGTAVLVLGFDPWFEPGRPWAVRWRSWRWAPFRAGGHDVGQRVPPGAGTPGTASFR